MSGPENFDGDSKSDPGTLLEGGEGKRNRKLFTVMGVSKHEEPVPIPDVLTEAESDAYNGVRLGVNWYTTLLAVDEYALEKDMDPDVLLFGICRVIEHFGIDRTRIILSGQGGNEEWAFVERILEQERIRAAYSRAIARTCELKSFNAESKTVGESFLRRMIDDAALMDRTLNDAQSWMDEISRDPADPTEFFDFFGVDQAPKYALGWGAPKSVRGEHYPRNLKDIDVQTLLYTILDGLVTLYKITDEQSVVMVPQSADMVSPVGGGDVSTVACLREAMIKRKYRRLDEGQSEAQRSGLIQKASRAWRIKSELSGLSFRSDEAPPPFGEENLSVPYYESRVLGNGNQYRRVPAHPWIDGFVENHMIRPAREIGTSSTYGFRNPQIRNVVERQINPLLRHVLLHADEERVVKPMLAHLSPRELKSAEIWAAAPTKSDLGKRIAPMFVNLPQHFEVLRQLTMLVSQNAREILSQTA